MTRVQTLQNKFSTMDMDVILISAPENRRYLSGFSGSAGMLLIDNSNSFIATDFRYWEQVGQEASTFTLIKAGAKYWPSIAEFITSRGWKRIGFEAQAVTYEMFLMFQELLPDCQWVPTNGIVEQLRVVKDQTEIDLLTEAARITDLALANALAIIKPGITEQDIALEYDYQLRKNGADGCSFDTIVASGWRGALPHGAPTDKKLEPGDLVVIDGGALFKGYHADLTRTVVVEKADSKQHEIYNIVLQAQLEALKALHAGIGGKDGDQIARDYITAAGYGEYFGHGLGHSVGLNIHENPRLSPTEAGILPEGTAVTVEPGIYLPGWGGIRIEDLVIVTAKGVRNLTGSPKMELVEV